MMQGDRKRQRAGSSVTNQTSELFPSNSRACLTSLKYDKEPINSEKLIFDDRGTSDVVIRLVTKQGGEAGLSSENGALELEVHVHRVILVQCRYFSALFSDRWQEKELSDEVSDEKLSDEVSDEKLSDEFSDEKLCRMKPFVVTMSVPSVEALEAYMNTFKLLYSKDFAEFILDIPTALLILPVAAELLFDECITACVRFLEAVPWSKNEEAQIKQLVLLLQLEESEELLARLSPVKNSALEDMMTGLVYAATQSHQNAASVKAFVANILSNFPSRDTVRLVLNKAFASNLKIVKDSVEEYTSPNMRGRNDEIEAMQRQNLHTAVSSGRQLLWLVERMIELRVAETAVLEWSEQRAFTANLKRAFSDDVWRNNVPGLPAVLLRCTCKFLNAMTTGTILTPRDVRKKLVRDWLPVLVTSRESVSSGASCNKQLHQELEVAFLLLIMTLPIPDSQELLQQCLSFTTRSLDGCPHLVSAFDTWFQRAGQESLIPLQKSHGKDS